MERLVYTCLLDQRGRTLWANCEQESLKEVWSKERSFLDSLHPSDQPRVEAILCHCLIRDRPGKTRMRFVVGDKIIHAHGEWSAANLAEAATVCTWNLLPENYQDFNTTDLQTLALLASGSTLRQIATQLERCESTIDARIRSLKAKLGQETLHGLVGQAARLGLLAQVLSEFEPFVPDPDPN